MGGLLWRASCENTAVPGGPLALQVKPALNVSRADFYTNADPLFEGRPSNFDWQTTVIGIHEVSVQPTEYVSGGLQSRPVVGRIAPAWVPTTFADVVPMTGNVSWRALPGSTPRGTQCGGPTFGQQMVFPASGGSVHQLYRMRYLWPATAPFIVYGAGTFDHTAGDNVVPAPAFVLYMASSAVPPLDRGQGGTGGGGFILNRTNELIVRQTYAGTVVFEEM